MQLLSLSLSLSLSFYPAVETELIELVRSEGKPLGIQIRTSRYVHTYHAHLDTTLTFTPQLLVNDTPDMYRKKQHVHAPCSTYFSVV